MELDVRVARDGVPVLLHDQTFARVQHRPGRVDELTAAELGAAGIPDLATVLRALRPPTFLDVELKGTDHGSATATILREARGERPGTAVISSFEDSTLAAMAVHLPGWTRWLNADDLAPATIARAVHLGCRVISVRCTAITPATLARVRTAGLELAAWPVRSREAFARLAALGVAAACVEGDALGAGRSPHRGRREAGRRG